VHSAMNSSDKFPPNYMDVSLELDSLAVQL
jgi:hypothetical protein